MTILPAPSAGSTGTVPDLDDTGPAGTFLADLTPITSPDHTDSSDTVGGRVLVKVLTIDNSATAEYAIPGNARRVLATVGISDTDRFGGKPVPATNGTFGVFADGLLLAQVTLKPGELAVLSTPLTGQEVIELGYTSPGDGYDRGDFGMARFATR